MHFGGGLFGDPAKTFWNLKVLLWPKLLKRQEECTEKSHLILRKHLEKLCKIWKPVISAQALHEALEALGPRKASLVREPLGLQKILQSDLFDCSHSDAHRSFAWKMLRQRQHLQAFASTTATQGLFQIPVTQTTAEHLFRTISCLNYETRASLTLQNRHGRLVEHWRSTGSAGVKVYRRRVQRSMSLVSDSMSLVSDC